MPPEWDPYRRPWFLEPSVRPKDVQTVQTVQIDSSTSRLIADFFRASRTARSGLSISCPFCHRPMTVRLRAQDNRAFLGCTGFPNCSGSHDVPEEAQSEARAWKGQPLGHAIPVETVVAARAPDIDKLATPGPAAKAADLLRKTQQAKENPMDKDVAKTAPASDAPVAGVMARLKKSASKAPYRMARMRALTTGKQALLMAMKPRVQPAAYDIMETFLSTDVGEGAVIGLLGLAGPMTPKLGKNKHVQALCEEFLDEGVAKGFNQVLSLVAALVEPALQSALAELPGVEEVADKVVPKRKKKRIATPARVASVPEEVEEEVEPRLKNALRAIPSR